MRNKRAKLKEVFDNLEAGQQEKFHRIFKSVKEVKEQRLIDAIKLCERTIEGNKKKRWFNNEE